MDLQGGWKIIAECDPETRSRRDLDSESDDEELNSKSIGWPMNENLVPPNAILDPKRLSFEKCDDFLKILGKKSPQRQWISWLSSVKSCSPQKRSKEQKERRLRVERRLKSSGVFDNTSSTEEISFTTEALVVERERNNASDGMLKGKVVMFGVNHDDDANFCSLPLKSPSPKNSPKKSPKTKCQKDYYPREWGCKDKTTSLSDENAKILAEKLLNPIVSISQRQKKKLLQNDKDKISSSIKILIETYYFPIRNSILNFKNHILSLPWKIQYKLLKNVQNVLKYDTTNFFTPADNNTKDYNEEYPINLECSMGMETQLTYTQKYPYEKEVLTLYLHHLQKWCSFPESCVPQNLLGIKLDRVLQPRLDTLEDASISKKESDSYTKIMSKLLESFRISCGADALLLHDVLFLDYKITIYNATQNIPGFYVKYFPDLKLVKNYAIFNKNEETKKNSLGTVTRIIQCYKDKDIKALHKDIFLRKVSECEEIRQCQKYPINKYFHNEDIKKLWNTCHNTTLQEFIKLSKELRWDDEEKWVDETEDLTFNGFLFALLFNNEEGFYPILLSFDKQKQQQYEQYIKDVYYSRFYMYKLVTDKIRRSNSLYIRDVPATYAELKKNVDVYKPKPKSKKPPQLKSHKSGDDAKSHSPPKAGGSHRSKSHSPPKAGSHRSKSHSSPKSAGSHRSKSPPHSPPKSAPRSPHENKAKATPPSPKPEKASGSRSLKPEKEASGSRSPASGSRSPKPKKASGSRSPQREALSEALSDRKYVQIVAANNKCADINQEKDPHELISWKCKPYKGEGGDDTVNQWFAYNKRTSHIISAITDMCLYVDEVKENERVRQGDCNKPNNEWEFQGKNLMLKGTDFALYTSKKGYFIISEKLPRQEYTLRKSPKTNEKYLQGINIPALDR